MTQTTGAITAVDAKLEYSANGTDWIDCSGVSNKVTFGGGDRGMTETGTLGTESPIVSAGRRKMVTASMVILYTETDSDPWHVFYDTYYTVKTPLYFRASPKGGQTNEYLFSCGPGYINTMLPPDLNADSETLLQSTINYTGPQWTHSKGA
jgi:hypothetical protein